MIGTIMTLQQWNVNQNGVDFGSNSSLYYGITGKQVQIDTVFDNLESRIAFLSIAPAWSLASNRPVYFHAINCATPFGLSKQLMPTPRGRTEWCGQPQLRVERGNRTVHPHPPRSATSPSSSRDSAASSMCGAPCSHSHANAAARPRRPTACH